ncbi:MAG: PD40 domain-containing protein [Planctomycetia bacterium]|nr:PD40 domain-containing protein [Planctomycetia bacterium]
MSSTRRNTFVGLAVLILAVGVLFAIRGCQPDGKPVANVTAAVMPPSAPRPSAADSARPGQIYFHRDVALAKIIPGEGLATQLPDAAAVDLQLNATYQIQSDRLSPDATRIIFGKAVIREIDGHLGSFPPQAIFVRQIDRSDPGKLLLRIGGGEIHNFLWSPDSANVAIAWHNEQGIQNTIFNIASQQPLEARLPKYHVDGKDHTMAIDAWAPDGKRMAVSDDGWLYLIGIERRQDHWAWAGRKRLTKEKQRILTGTCTFSPDGRNVAFVTIEKGVAMSLQVAAVDDGEQRTIVPAGKFTDLSPAWSPDSRKIAYSAAHLDADGQRAGRSGIYTVEVAAENPQPTPILEEVHPPPIMRLRVIDWR